MLKKWLYRLLGKDGRAFNRHDFTEEETSKSHIARLEAAIRKERIDFLKMKLQRMKQAQEEWMLEEQVADLENDLYGDDDDESDSVAEPINPLDPDSMLQSLLMQVLSGAARAKTQGEQPIPSGQQKQSLSDEQLREYKKQVPEYILKKLKKLDDEALIQQLRAYKPEILESYDQDTIKRAILILRE